MLHKIALYYRLTKPGILRGNAVHVLAGAFLASAYPFDWKAIFGVLVGTSLIIASACVANNYVDRGIDAKMVRTKKRASVTGEISTLAAMIFGTLLLLLGLIILYALTNLLVILIGLIAYFVYVVAYGIAKRRTVHSTLVGAIPGALPAMAGYVAVTGELDAGAWLLFLLVLVWQMPHFYAISIFRKDEYKAADIPVLGAIKPFVVVKRFILGYMLLYFAVIALMIATGFFGYEGLILIAGSAFWFYVYITAKGSETKWARSIFGTSLLLTLLLLLVCGLNVFMSPAA